MDPIQQEPKKEVPPVTLASKEDRAQIKSLRTYQGDVEEAIAKNNYSATTVLVAEQKRRIEKPRAVEEHRDPEIRNKFFTVLGITLVSLGILAVAAVYYVRSTEKVVIEQQTKTLVDFNKEISIPIASSTRDTFITNVLTEKVGFKDPLNSVLYLNTMESGESEFNKQKFLLLLAPNMPASLVRSLENSYMLGVFSFDTSEPFIILTTKDYASAYAGMLKWEQNVVTDLGRMFQIDEGVGTKNTFYDEAIRNKDLRVLRDAGNKTVLVYSFIDKNTLVITKNENIFNAILAKYLTSKNTR